MKNGPRSFKSVRNGLEIMKIEFPISSVRDCHHYPMGCRDKNGVAVDDEKLAELVNVTAEYLVLLSEVNALVPAYERIDFPPVFRCLCCSEKSVFIDNIVHSETCLIGKMSELSKAFGMFGYETFKDDANG